MSAYGSARPALNVPCSQPYPSISCWWRHASAPIAPSCLGLNDVAACVWSRSRSSTRQCCSQSCHFGSLFGFSSWEGYRLRKSPRRGTQHSPSNFSKDLLEVRVLRVKIVPRTLTSNRRGRREGISFNDVCVNTLTAGLGENKQLAF